MKIKNFKDFLLGTTEKLIFKLRDTIFFLQTFLQKKPNDIDIETTIDTFVETTQKLIQNNTRFKQLTYGYYNETINDIEKVIKILSDNEEYILQNKDFDEKDDLIKLLSNINIYTEQPRW